MAPKGKLKKNDKVTSTIAREDNGNIQITYTIPFKIIDDARNKTAQELGKDITVPGFRKGNAPLSKLIDHIPENTLLEKTLIKILPPLIGDSIKEHNLKLAIYPRFELVKAVDGEDWQVRAVTCDVPEISLGDYRSKIQGALRSKALWTPGKSENDKKQPPTRAEKEQVVMKSLIDNVKVNIPKILVDEEVNSRLSQLLERIEKLGLNLDSYLASLGKTAVQLRVEYESQAKEALALDLILSKVADAENIKIKESDIDEAIKASSADQKLSEGLNTPERRSMVKAVLKKRAALNQLVALS